MKKLILTLSIIMLSTTAAFANSVVPQKLTLKESRNPVTVNRTAEQIFKTVNDSIDVSKYPPVYKNFRLMYKENTQQPGYYYVKSGDAELMYEKDTNALKYVTFRTSGTPRSWIVYNYPSGKLRQVDIWVYLGEVYSFNSDGVFIDYPKYVDGIEKAVKANWKLSKAKRAKLAVSGKSKPGVQVVLTINYQGTLEQCKAFKQSKSDEFNNSIYDAVWKSSPFKVPYPFTTRAVDVKLDF